MDVYHKVLTKLYEITGGRDSVDVDLGELLKKEGFFPSIDNISEYMSSESWIALTARKHIIRITHWGVAEAKRALSSSPDTGREVEKLAAKLTSKAREFLVMAEEFAALPTAERVSAMEKRCTELAEDVKKIKASL